MLKDRVSITIDNDVNKKIKKEATKQRRSYSGMVEFICYEYLIVLKKQRGEGKNKNITDNDN